MKTPDKYRFSLQWGAETAEKVQAGDFLESLGNRKSEFIILAVTEYLAAHPEALNAGRKLQIIVKPNVNHEQLKAMVLSMIEEKMSGMVPAARVSGEPGAEPVVTDTEVDEMLKNLDLFSQ